jgi:putative DNA primase/helicase
VSLLGGIQPGRLLAYGSGAVNGGPTDDGLFQRLQILVWPDIPKECRLVDRAPNTKAFEGFVGLFKRLCGLDIDTPIQSKFSCEAQELFDAWRAELEQRNRTGDNHEAMESHLSKYRSLMPSLALLFMLADWATKGGDNSVVDLRHAQLAAAWCSYLDTHAVRVYSKLRNRSSDHARALAEKILAGKVPRAFAARDIYLLKGWSGLTEPEEVKKACEILIDLNWLRLEVNKETGGRNSCRYLVNPKIEMRVPNE